LIRDTDINWLVKESIHVFVSMDGLVNGHGAMRNLTNGLDTIIFNRIIDNIKMLIKAGVIVKINTAVHRYNLKELEGMYDLLKSLGVFVWRMTVSKDVGRYMRNKNKFSVEKKELSFYIKDIIRLYLKDVKKTRSGIIVPLDMRIANIFKSEMLIKPLISYKLQDSSCDYQKERVTIKSNGDVVPCGLLVDHVFGNVRRDDIKRIINNKKLREIKNIAINDIKECKICKYAHLCGGGCRVSSLAEYGDLLHKDSYACLCMNILFKDVKKILQENNYNIKISKKPFFSRKKVYIRNNGYAF